MAIDIQVHENEQEQFIQEEEEEESSESRTASESVSASVMQPAAMLDREANSMSYEQSNLDSNLIKCMLSFKKSHLNTRGRLSKKALVSIIFHTFFCINKARLVTKMSEGFL